MACKRFVGSIPIASTQLTRAFAVAGGSSGGLEMDVVRDPCAISSVGVGICRRGTGHFASLATGGGVVAEQAFHPLCRFGDDRSDPVAVVPVDGLRVVAEQVGHLLDGRSGVEKE